MPERSIAQGELAEHAALSVHIAAADFRTALEQATTRDDADRICGLIDETTAALRAVESTARRALHGE